MNEKPSDKVKTGDKLIVLLHGAGVVSATEEEVVRTEAGEFWFEFSDYPFRMRDWVYTGDTMFGFRYEVLSSDDKRGRKILASQEEQSE